MVKLVGQFLLINILLEEDLSACSVLILEQIAFSKVGISTRCGSFILRKGLFKLL